MIRPQLGSWPLMAVLTSGELATLRAADQRVRRLAAPAHGDRHELGGALAVGDQHAGQLRHQRPRGRAANCRRPRAARLQRRGSRPARWPARPRCRWWTGRSRRSIRLNERSTARRTHRAERAARDHGVGGHEAEHRGQVRLEHRRRPWRCRPCVTGRPLTSTRSAASLGRVSVVMMASAAARPPCGDSDLTSFGSAARILSIGSGTPITPVAAISTWRGGDAEQVAHEPGHLAGVLDALLAGADVGAAAGGHDRLGRAAAHVLHRDQHRSALHLVRREHGGRRARASSEWISARSFLPLGLIPADDAAGEESRARR